MFDTGVDTAQERAPASLYSEKTTRLSGPSAPRMVRLIYYCVCYVKYMSFDGEQRGKWLVAE